VNTQHRIPCPSADEFDLAPQMIVVVLADAALLAVNRALESAHPLLAATTRFDRPPPWLLASEHLAAQVLDLSAELAARLHDYADALRLEIEDIDDDSLDPF
jgi:hypothetical protein